jgi:putative transposase
MVTAAQRRRAVEHRENRRIRERRACRLVGFSRSAAWSQPRVRDDATLRARLKTLAQKYPRYGYPTLHSMLRIEGLVQDPKRIYRLYREEGLQVRTKRRKKLTRPRIPMSVPSRANERWSMDFVSDQLANGRRLRVLNVVDDFTREFVLQVVDFSISGERVARTFNQPAHSLRLPSILVCDNGPEFTRQSMFFWARERRVKLHFIQPGKPIQNAFVESLSGKFRDYWLNLNWFDTLNDARSTISQCRNHYNTGRPTAHWTTGRLSCSPGKPPDMLDLPHCPMLDWRGIVKEGHDAIK